MPTPTSAPALSTAVPGVHPCDCHGVAAVVNSWCTGLQLSGSCAHYGHHVVLSLDTPESVGAPQPPAAAARECVVPASPYPAPGVTLSPTAAYNVSLGDVTVSFPAMVFCRGYKVSVTLPATAASAVQAVRDGGKSIEELGLTVGVTMWTGTATDDHRTFCVPACVLVVDCGRLVVMLCSLASVFLFACLCNASQRTPAIQCSDYGITLLHAS